MCAGPWEWDYTREFLDGVSGWSLMVMDHTGTLVLTLQIDIFLFLLLNDTAYI